MTLTVLDGYCGAGGSSSGAEQVPGVALKTCRKCHETKPLTMFHKRSGRSRDGHRNECKSCSHAAEVGKDRSAYQAAYRQRHCDRLRESDRQRPSSRPADYWLTYRAANREQLLATEQRYRNANRHKELARRHARRATPLDVTAKEYVTVLLKDPCSYCGSAAGTVDHIVPVVAGGNNDWTNLTAACQSCNSSKNAKPLLAFLLATRERRAVTPPAARDLIAAIVEAITGDVIEVTA